MFLTMKVAFRNISRQKKRSFLLAGAIAFGMLVITLMNALTGGSLGTIRDTLFPRFRWSRVRYGTRVDRCGR